MKLLLYIYIFSILLSCSLFQKKYAPLKQNDFLELNISDINYETLKGYRNIALREKVISKSLKKYVKGFITYEGKKIPIKLRLKGDWTDHLKSNKWSFRIKILGNNSFKELKSFSIQSPHTRSFLYEWFMHKVYLNEDVLTTRYEFIPVKINGKIMGIYAIEEHFDKQLIESRKRREGPILKFNEDGIWETRVNNPTDYLTLPYYAAAEVIPFKKNRTLKTPRLKEHFKTAQSLLLRHKNFDPNTEEIFDINKLAKFYALTDLANTDHSLIWHNLRYYFNPVSRKLEPIAYDCYPEDINKSKRQSIFGYNKNFNEFPDYHYVNYYLFNNKKFKAKYIQYLKKYSTKEYLNSILLKLQPELDSLNYLLQKEYPDADFDKQFYINNVDSIIKALPLYSKSKIKYALKAYPFEDFTHTNLYYYNTGLKVYSSPFQDSLKKIVQLFNYHSTPISVLGYSLNKNKDSLILFNQPLVLDRYSIQEKEIRFTLPLNSKAIFFVADNKKTDTLKIKISKWAFTQSQITSFPKIEKIDLNSLKGLKIDSLKNQLILTNGVYSFSKDLIIPKGWLFIIEKGTEINQINQSAIISYSPIIAKGTNNENIFLNSSDNSGQGLVIIDEYGESSLQNITFSNLNSLHKNGWNLTGAVTFYQSNVSFNKCKFKNIHSEDALNLVRSTFLFSNSIISNTFSDGLDADFCQGNITHSSFSKTGNDCIDLSGSDIKISNCKISQSGDKGISSGEKSTVEISGCNIENVKIAVASKDLSTVTINSIVIKNVELGYIAFQKKPEYGPAKIYIKESIESNIKNNLVIDKNSKIIYKKDTIIGKTYLAIDSLYF
jgi:hypothetical protein